MALKGAMFGECSMFWNKVGFLVTVSLAFKVSLACCFVLCFGEKYI